MNNDTTCNGWSNYATWRINLEIVDDYISSLTEGEISFPDTESLAAHLEEVADYVITNFGEIESSLALDYARAFMQGVNWHEIADAQATGDDAWLIESDEGK